MIFQMLLKNFAQKKNSKKTNQLEPIEAIFSSIQNTCMPWGTSENQIQVCRVGKKNEVSKFPQNHILLWMPSIITTYGSKK